MLDVLPPFNDDHANWEYYSPAYNYRNGNPKYDIKEK
jgi:hypothetical protein